MWCAKPRKLAASRWRQVASQSPSFKLNLQVHCEAADVPANADGTSRIASAEPCFDPARSIYSITPAFRPSVLSSQAQPRRRSSFPAAPCNAARPRHPPIART